MEAKKIKANRKSIRAPVVPAEVRGLLFRLTTNEQLPFLIWDVSEEGLGIWSSDKLNQDEKINLALGQPFLSRFDCIVKWCIEDHEKGGFRCGLEADAAKDVRRLYDMFRKIMEAGSD